MKKLFIFVVALLPTLAMAENLQQVYKSLVRPSAQQIAAQETSGKNAINAAEANYQTAKQKLDADYVSCQQEVARVQQVMREYAANRKKPTQAQVQATGAIAGDMMSALAAAGISMEDVAKMSDEEIMAILAPTMAQKTGLSQTELEKLSKMSDREAEAYMKAHPEMIARAQNSQYGQYGQAMQGSANSTPELSDADAAKLERIEAISEQLQDMEDKSSINVLTSQGLFRQIESYKTTLEAQFVSNGYAKRIDDIYKELDKRYAADGLYGGKGGPATVPEYTKSYIARVNKLIEEYNTQVTNQWVNEIQKHVDMLDNELKARFSLYLERINLYNGIKSDYAKGMCAHYLTSLGERSKMNMLVELLEKRLEAPVKFLHAVPEYVSAQ